VREVVVEITSSTLEKKSCFSSTWAMVKYTNTGTPQKTPIL
jgi:hypothetical protein